MWKKPDSDDALRRLSKATTPSAVVSARSQPIASADVSGNRKANIIGPSVSIKGDVKGEEDMIILGYVEGSLDFRNSDLLVGAKGRVSANIIANTIRIEGEVKGELRAVDRVTIRPSGSVIGNIIAPRVVLEDGCKLQGAVDMNQSNNTAANTPDGPERQQPARLRSTNAAKPDAARLHSKATG